MIENEAKPATTSQQRRPLAGVIPWATAVLVATLGAAALAGQPPPAAPRPAPTGVAELLADAGIEGKPAAESRRTRPAADRSAAELTEALDRFGSELEASVGSAAASGVALDELLLAYQRLQAADLLLRQRFAAVRRRLEGFAAPALAFERLDAAEGRYTAAADALLAPLAAPMAALTEARAHKRQLSAAERGRAVAALRAVRGRMAGLGRAASPPILRSELPHRPAGLAARPPASGPAIVPSYLDAADPVSDPADLAGSPAAPLSAEIVAQAEALGFDAVAVYEFVRNEIATEYYAGGLKGAAETLRQRAGNDVDQASLLIALLRASSVPARYVHGSVERTIEAMAESLGIAEPEAVPAALARAGVAHRPVIRGGRLAAVEVEQTWVSAHVPYTNYRGAVVDFSGRTWVPLAPAIKGVDRVAPTGVLRAMGLSVDAATAQLLAAPQTETPLSWLRRQVEGYLATVSPGTTFESQLGSAAVRREQIGLLPNTLAVPVVAVTGEAPSLEAARRQSVRFVVRSGPGEGDPVILDAALPVAEVAGRRLTLSYQPATVDDHAIVNAFGGLDRVPVYLVELRPRVMVGGRLRFAGEASLAMGTAHRVELVLSGPWGSERVASTLVAGSYQSIAIGAQRFVPRPDLGSDPTDGETTAARLLSQVAQSYGERWDRAETQIAGLLASALVRPMPAAVFAANAVRVESALGLPVELVWEGVTLDAALRVAEPLAPASDGAAARDILRLSGLQGSALEHVVFEDVFQVDSISADKGLGLAREAGQAVLRIDSGNSAALLPTLAHPPEVVADVDNRVRLGQVVEIPQGPVVRNAWSGSVWRAADPVSGASAYLIAGGLAGGATTVPPASWLLDFLADALAAPYSSEPNSDPLAAALIVKVLESDGQEGEVDEELPVALAVTVRDERGRPVEGAAVSFVSHSGGGRLIDEEGGESSELTVETDRLGIASVGLRLGTDTSADPIYLLRDEGDEWASQALIHLIDASVASQGGPIAIEEPFTAIAFPGEPESLRRTNPPEGEILAHAASWSDTLAIVAEDRFGNPVSNVDITFEVGPASPRDPTCSNLASNLEPGVVFDRRVGATGPAACTVEIPFLGDCGVPSFTAASSYRGVVAGFIMGASTLVVYPVLVSSPGLDPPLRFEYAVAFTQFSGDDSCGAFIVRRLISPSPLFGGNATRVGQPFAGPVGGRLASWEQDFTFAPDNVSRRLRHLDTGKWGLLQPESATFLVSNGGSATAPVEVEPSKLEATITAGPTPGLNEVTLQLNGWRDWEGTYADPTDELPEESIYAWLLFPAASGFSLNLEAEPVWGVLPTVDAVAPAPLVLTERGRTATEVTLSYTIQPAEYEAGDAEILIYEDGEVVGTAQGSSHSGSGTATIQRGFALDIDKSYEAELVLNRGGISEVVSDRVPLPLFQGLFRDVDPPQQISQEIDLLNERRCDFATAFSFGLTQESAVTLRFKAIDAQETDGTPIFGQLFTLLEAETLAEGDYGYLITPSGAVPADLSLPPGDYQWELIGVSAADGHEESLRGFIASKYRLRDSLPIGHAMVKGVDLWDGHLALGRTDFTVPGRGVDLELKRSYSSQADGPPGPLGVGWVHSYESYVTVTPCGEAIVVGGEGSGLRFVDDGEGGLRPLKGHHGTLIANPDLSFDFYTKAGTRYHYGELFGDEWLLSFIEDPNGNRTDLTYDTSQAPAELLSVRDAAGRTLSFTYGPAEFLFLGQLRVLTRVEGPGGLRVDYQYDPYGNLTRATREPHGEGIPSREERYTYATGVDDPLDGRHRMLTAEDTVSGATTTFAYDRAAIGFQGDILVPLDHVISVTEPEGGTTAIAIDTAELAAPTEPTLTTTVTDRRGMDTVYVLNRYGSPLSVTDPLGNVTAMQWSPDDIVITSRTDANGHAASYLYDGDANLLSESLTVTDVDGGTRTVARSFTYLPADSFAVAGIKNRVATATDRNGDVTTFTYDGHGNLTTEAVQGTSHRITHSYLSNGDRAATTDPNNHTTTFAYDAYGNLATKTDPLGGVATTSWDARSRPIVQVDELGRATRFVYDTLDRAVRRELPPVAGESGPPAETVVYDDPSRTVTVTDAASRTTTTSYDLEGRPVRIENAEGALKLFEYDAEGNKILESTWHDPDTPRFDTHFVYDAAGRQVRVEEPLGRTTAMTYDGVGNVVEERLSDRDDATFEPRVATHAYDELNRRIRTERAVAGGPAVTQRRLDGEGNLVVETDPLGRQTVAQYDPLDRVTRIEEPPWTGIQPKVTIFGYDAAGNRLTEVRENTPTDQIRRFKYDALNRLIEQTDATGARSLIEYDAGGNRTRVIDPLLNVHSFAYDARDRLISDTAHLDRVTVPGRLVTTEYRYDAVGNRTEEHLPNGNVVTHQFDGLDRLKSSSDLLGPLATYGYDARGNAVRETDGNGNVTERDFDALDRVVEERLPESRTVAIEWDAAGNKVAETDAEGNRRAYTYDQLNRLIEVADPSPFLFTAAMSYDLAGNKLTETDRRGHLRAFAYDSLDRLSSITEPAPWSYTTSFTYDALGNQLTETDRRGIVTENAYDAENRLIETKRAGVVLSSIQYDAAGNRRFATDANGNVTGYEYDERNLLTAENRPLAAISRFALDDMGDRVEDVDPEGRTSSFVYDGRRRLLEESNGASETKAHAYDGNGNRIQTIRPELQAWTYRYDGADRLVEVENPLTETTAYTYDGNGNRLTVIDAETRVTTYAYDELDRLTSLTYPGGTDVETYAYDENGNRTQVTDPKGQVTTTTYDELDRVSLVTYSLPSSPTGDDLESIATQYDANNNPVRYAETYGGPTGLRETVESYDDFDRLTSVTDPQGEMIAYSYDANGNRRSVTDPDGHTTLYAFDALNRVLTVTVPGAGVTEYAWYKDGRLRQVLYPNSTSARYTYDLAGRTATIENRQGAAAVVSSYAYSYDTNGNRTQQVEANGGAAETTSYSFDPADRLLSVVYPERTVTYTYDGVGNRITEQIVATPGGTVANRTYAYDARHRLRTITDSADPSFNTTYDYDANGNRISKARGGTTTDYLYDTRDQLSEVRDGGSLLEAYRYDYRGMRIRKAGAGGIVRYVYDDSSVLLETDDFGNTAAKYEYGPDRLLSLLDSTEGRQFYLFDTLRSVVALTRPDGGLQARYKYDAWGNLRSEAGSSANRFGFTGYERDEDTGLYYAKARFYDPETGRFLSEDPFSGQVQNPPSLHRYLYGYQNPTVYFDPTGRQAEETKQEGEDDTPFFLQPRPRVLSSPSEAPAGWRVERIGEDIYVAYPPGYQHEEKSKDEEPEEKGWWEKATDWLTERVDKLKRTGAKWEELFDEGVGGRAPDVETASELPHTLGEANDLSDVADLTVQTKEVGKAGLDVAEQGVEIYEAATGAGTIYILVKNGIKRYVEKKAAKKLLAEGWELVDDDIAVELVERGESRAVRGAEAAARGLAREERVADLVGGQVSRERIKTAFGSSDIDVLGPAGELIGVGGPAKAVDLSKFGSQLKVLKAAADERGVSARMFLEEGTPQEAIDLAVRKLGAENVVIFPAP